MTWFGILLQVVAVVIGAGLFGGAGVHAGAAWWGVALLSVIGGVLGYVVFWLAIFIGVCAEGEL